MKPEKIGFIGLGLIGGSIAKTIRRIHPEIAMIAYDIDTDALNLAVTEQVISKGYQELTTDFADCRYIFLCAPVQKNSEFLEKLSNFAGENCIITDVGSVKTPIHQEISHTRIAPYFIGGHPMAGSEKSGYEHATSYLLENAYYILTPSPEIKQEIVKEFEDFIASLGAITMTLDYEEHDYITASISHLPHILASNLVNLVKSIDDDTETMKTVAAGGFRDITRIASSSPVMWQQICLTNQTQIIKLIDLFIDSLAHTKDRIAHSSSKELFDFFQNAKDYRDSITINTSGPIPKIHEIYCDMADEAGGIATLATILSEHNISIKNIGIIHNREFQEGVLHIEFYEERSRKEAVELLRSCQYTIYER
ncbi:MAG: prephenate dehydrogenase [Lachnospiraceae bacterium]|jgi:prephenate dehydrogenase|nr:prephenate dehydrogenase [Lachnospiraceae bacterium]